MTADIKPGATLAEVKAAIGQDIIAQFTDQEKALSMIYCWQLYKNRKIAEGKEQAARAAAAEALRPWTYHELKQHVLELAEHRAAQSNFEFVLDENNEPVLHLLLLYFTNDPAFEKEGLERDGTFYPYSLKKGIFLQSPERGTGKSFLLSLFSINKRNCFYVEHVPGMRAMLLRDKEAGINELDKRSQLQRQSISNTTFRHEYRGFMYDEMFGEEKAVWMGNPFSISEYIIQRLYDQRPGGEDWFWKFHLTSNYAGPTIEEKVGATVRSRMVEMFNMIKLKGPDRRIRKR